MDPNFKLDDLLRNIGDFTEDAILVTEAEPIDMPGPRIVWCNSAFTRMTGYSLDDIKGQSPRILHGEAPDRRELDRLRRALENWESCRVELENFRKDGTPFWVEFIVRPVADSTGWFRYWISVQRETTERRRRAALLETTQRMLDEAPIGLGVLGADLSVNYANGQLDRLFHPGAPPPLTPIPLRVWLRRGLEGSFKLGANAARDQVETILQGISRSPYWAEITLGGRWYMFRRARLRNEASLLVVDDVTERHELKAELDFAMRLESMGQLAGGIAHDFNNLLAVTLGNLEVALDEDDKRSRDECIENAIASIMSSREIIRQLLTFARRIPADRAEVDVNRFLEDFRKVIAVACPDSVETTISSELDDALVLVDRSQLETALLNLVLNGVDAMDGRGKLKIEVAPTHIVSESEPGAEAKQQPALEFRVSDIGRGIPSEDIARVIEPFFSTKSGMQGTGLGLSMVHGFARQAGGELRIESEVGTGTTVRLSLPLLVRDAGLPSEEIPGANGLPTGLRVMIVDDDAGIRRVLRLFLRGLDWSIEEAESGDAAASRLRSGERFDLLITDLSMPGEMQGDVLAAFAADLDRKIRCIVLTGNPDYATMPSSSQQFLVKPLRRNEFLCALQKALD